VSLRRRLTMSLACVVLCAVPAHAQSKEDGWQFQITPYLWGAGLDGDVKLGRLPAAGVEASFSDVWDHLHFAAMAAFEGRKGRWGFVTDAFYVDLTDTVPAPVPAFGEVKVSITQEIYTGLALYRAVDGAVTVDILAGPRYTTIDNELSLIGGVADGRSRSATLSWWDLLAGARVRWQSESGWFVNGYADVGGSDTDFTWEVLAGGGYRFKKLCTLSAGYRYLSEDYDEDGNIYDMVLAGPIVGVGFRF